MANTGPAGDVFERPIATVAVEPVLRASCDRRIGERAAVDEKEIDPAVGIVVEEHGAGAHRFDQMFVGARAVGVMELDTRLARDVDELRQGILRREEHRSRDGDQ